MLLTFGLDRAQVIDVAANLSEGGCVLCWWSTSLHNQVVDVCVRVGEGGWEKEREIVLPFFLFFSPFSSFCYRFELPAWLQGHYYQFGFLYTLADSLPVAEKTDYFMGLFKSLTGKGGKNEKRENK